MEIIKKFMLEIKVDYFIETNDYSIIPVSIWTLTEFVPHVSTA